MNLYTYTNEFIQKELEMFFSDKENDFTHAIYSITPIGTGKASYRLTLNGAYSNFASELAPANVFQYVTQIVDDVKEVIVGDHGIDYRWWNDVVFSRDTTFDTAYFDSPVPTIIFKSNDKVGSLGKVLLCFYEDQLTLRDLKGRIYDTDTADINALNNGGYTYRSLNLSAMPKSYFIENTRLRDEDSSLWGAHQDNVDDIDELSTRLDDSVDYLQEEHEANYDAIEALQREFESGGDVYVLKADYQTLSTKVDGIETKTNEMYPRVVGDDSLLSSTYRKALRNQVDIYDLDRELHGYEDEETEEHVDGTLEDFESRISTNESNIADHNLRITANRNDIDDIMAYPEFNMTGIPPFYCFRQSRWSATNRAYDPVLWEDTEDAGTPNTTASLQWLHVAEKRIKEMPLRILKDDDIRTSATRLCTEADGGTVGNKIELGCYLNNFCFFAASPSDWTTSSSYTEKQIMCRISIVPARFGGNDFKPALLFEIMTGHLDGGSAAGDCTGMFVLMDKSETATPDYHWYRYGDNANVNGMALADVKIQYH